MAKKNLKKKKREREEEEEDKIKQTASTLKSQIISYIPPNCGLPLFNFLIRTQFHNHN
jgi:methionine synthase II (cobalamin-independent)